MVRAAKILEEAREMNILSLVAEAKRLAKGRLPLPPLEVAAATGKGRILSSTAAHLCQAAKYYKAALKPVGNFKLFTDANGRVRLLTKELIEDGTAEKAGLKVLRDMDGEATVDPGT